MSPASPASLSDRSHPLLIVAAITPLSDDGERLDLDAIPPYVDFLTSHGADGVFACGTVAGQEVDVRRDGVEVEPVPVVRERGDRGDDEQRTRSVGE
jgi:hypothetical protein